MNLNAVDEQTQLLVNNGHKVFQIHRFAKDDESHLVRLERWAELPQFAKVLDMGSGVGELAKVFTKLRPDLNFYLVNLSKLQLSYSKEFTCHCCSFLDVPEQSESFDAVLFCFSIGHEDVEVALKEAHRLLKNNGILFIYDMVRVFGNNENMKVVEYVVNSKETMQKAATGFKLDFYLEPTDDGQYGKSILGEAFDYVFNGTIPAIWRFVKC
jgi:SAM-dependent methyltransferase